MPVADFLDAQAAIDWAGDQQPKLAKRIADWAGSYSIRIAVEGGRKAYYVTANPVPAIINAETGSVINSIRTSLDLLASTLAARNGHPGSRHVYFPVCKSLVDFQNGKSGGMAKIKLLSAADQATIASLKPYKGGDDLLYALHDLDIMRKHRRLVGVVPFPRGVGIYPTDGTSAPASFNSQWKGFSDTIPIAWTDAIASDCKVDLGVYVAIDEPGAVYGQQVVVALPKFVNLANSILARFRCGRGRDRHL
jgi:hypothetical protein